MTDLIWSPQSVADVEEIRAYIAVDSKLYADLTVQRIVAAVERLGCFPTRGGWSRSARLLSFVKSSPESFESYTGES